MSLRKILLSSFITLGFVTPALAGGLYEGFPDSALPLTGSETIPNDTNLSGGRQPQTAKVTTDVLKSYIFGNAAAVNATATGTGGTATVTANGGRGKITTGAVAAVAAQVITMTNSNIASTSIMLFSVSLGTGTTPAVVSSYAPGTGSGTITLSANDGATNLNGTYVVSYVIIN